jgi:hypothetical protein
MGATKKTFHSPKLRFLLFARCRFWLNKKKKGPVSATKNSICPFFVSSLKHTRRA